MNTKRARRIRQELRNRDIGPEGTQYLQHKKTKSIILDPECGRAIYKRTKKVYEMARKL